MCKYCKRLKELKDFEKKSYEQIISDFCRRDLLARNLIKNLVQLQVFSLATQRRLLDEADEFVKCNWIGK